MKRATLLASVAIALAVGSAPSFAQMQQKGSEGGAPAQPSPAPSGSAQDPGARPQAQPAEKAPATSAEPRDRATKGTAQKGGPEPKDKGPRGAAEKGAEPKDKSTKGAAQKGPEPKDKGTKGAAQKGPEPKDKGTAENAPDPKERSTKGAAQKGPGPSDKAGAGRRADVPESKRDDFGRAILRDRNVNRADNVNISIRIGARMPRSVRLAVLPATVLSIVPAYRGYRYFVVEDRICIVDPGTYEVIDIIEVSDTGQTARSGGHGAGTLVLSDDERAFILSEIDLSGDSTLGLGAMTEGAEVPRGVEVRVFPARVVEQLPKMRGYKFFTTENRLAIVDPEANRVRLVLEAGR